MPKRVTGMDSKRRTGRTTRMIEAAIKSVAGGNYAYIIAADTQHRDYLWEMCKKLSEDPSPFSTPVRCYPKTGGAITLLTSYDELWCWEKRQVIGAIPSFKIFIDHYTIECRYGDIINLWELWDKQ